MSEVSTLDKLAREFADRLSALTRGVLGEDTPLFHAVTLEPGRKIRLQPLGDDRLLRSIPVRIGAEVRINLLVMYDCCWDGTSTFLAADRSEIKVLYDGVPDPLFRFEYERAGDDPPGAHIHVHAHRDEVAYLLRLADSGRPRKALRKNRMPRSAELHLPVGGHRLRPSLEDVLLFLKREFEIATTPHWRTVLDDHLRDWRLTQLKSAVRDAPEAAAEALRTLQYQVLAPALPAQRADSRVRLFRP
ncbi:hypothetical protein SAMN06297387_113169 [Streptomyces zhaozhouensis]|uniref:Uncharacterized protein n=1 Tax=Streptomyces zhaozhouensis TaxID=1300267 RepID=A0A286DZH2_9ACTN|nr:hypothetical protein [Streptomyces zhaozhouensis]SOD64010.1 hypothetical protein SAMN06297387_113169 [Streptomyces zhaozhouensis]